MDLTRSIAPRIAIAVPNLNQARFLAFALESIPRDRCEVVCAVLDAGSTDDSDVVIAKHARDIAYTRSHTDAGQAAAVNEGIGWLAAHYPSVEYVTWLNADDFYLGGGLAALSEALDKHSEWVAVSGRAVVTSERGEPMAEYPTAPFDRATFSVACTICQPATLIRRDAWERVGGLDISLDMCFDYDLWWRLANAGRIGTVSAIVAASRDHGETKTRQRRERYFVEAKRVVARETGRVPWHWYISEAIEREAAFEVGRRPPPVALGRAVAHAAADYCRDRLGALR